jgi:formylglycine-generating enzyme required for sulfatase activity
LRWRYRGLLLTLALSTVACNKGRSIIAEAQKLHATGTTEASVAQLDRVEKEAPNTPEVAQARDLAASWSVEAFDQSKPSPRGGAPRGWLDEALRRSPSNGPARARLCKWFVDQQQWADAHTCLDVDISKASASPLPMVEAARAELAAHDQQVERLAWSTSSSPLDWLRLVRKYQGSDEATAAKPKILSYYTFCGNEYNNNIITELLGVTDKVVEQVSTLGQWAIEADDATIARNRFAGALAVVGERQRNNATRIQSTIDEIGAHAILPDEAKVRADVLADYGSVIGVAKSWATLERFADLDRREDPISAYASTRDRASSSAARLMNRVIDRDGCNAIVNTGTASAIIAGLIEKFHVNDLPAAPLAGGSSPPPAASARRPEGSAAPAGGSPLVPQVVVRAGAFTMGSDTGSPADRPARQVTLTKGFSIDTTEVTVAAYQTCVDAGACTASGVHGKGYGEAVVKKYGPMCNVTVPDRANNPINCIDRVQAEAYCRYAKKRLPTEAEWEYAARGTDARDYPWGNGNPTCALGAFGNVLGGKQCRTVETRTVDVGHFPAGASPAGALDMAGNVWEWVADGWDADAYTKTPTTDPVVPLAGESGVLRGGSWDFPADKAKVSRRLKFPAGEGNVSTGVRCAADGIGN